jgi:hypothetical protein
METTPAPAILINLIPLYILMTFLTFGPNESEVEKEGIFMIAWLTAVLLTALGSVIVGSKELIIYRFFQYFMAPWAIFIGLGIYAAYRMFMELKFKSIDGKTPRPHARAGFTAAILVTILVISAGATAYPDRSTMANFQEGITHDEMDGVYWCRDNLEDDATLASDHRLSSMAFGFGGVNASWDYVVDVFHEESFEDARDELNQSSIPSGKKRIDYIMLSDELKKGVALFQNREAEPMSDEAIAKFEREPFIKIYESNGVEVYLIDWSDFE